MDLFRKRKNPPASSGKHSKLGEGWDENSEAVTEGISFYLKYLGSTLLDELPLGESYGEGVSSRAVRRIVDMAKTEGKKLEKVLLCVTPLGIKVINRENKQTLIDVTIYRISFCTADKNHDKVFAFIARNTINETMECHAFYCAKQKIAQAVTLSVSQAFNLARDKWEKSNNKKNTQHNKSSKEEENQRIAGDSLVAPAIPPRAGESVHSAPQVDLLSDSHPRLSSPDTNWIVPGKVDNRSASPRQGWQTFDDNEDNKSCGSSDTDSIDDFAQLAENRVRSKNFGAFSTNLRQEDVDDSVRDYLDGGQKSLEAFSRIESDDDLSNL